MTRRKQLLAGLVACLALAACEDPYTQGTQSAAKSSPRDERPQAQRARGDELPPDPPPAREGPALEEAPAGRTARATLAAFCTGWANWSWRTIGRQQRRLAGLATGRLAAQLAAEAGRAKLDRALRRDRLAMRGRVVALDLDPPGGGGRVVCVSRELEIQNGRGELGGGRHRVYLAALERTPRGWGVSRWEPQP
jgi:hypothetical protein